MAGGYPVEDEQLSRERPNQVNSGTPRETLLMVLQRDGSQLAYSSEAMRGDKQAATGNATWT